MFKGLGIVVICVAFGAALGGCIFSPHKAKEPGPEPPPVYLIPDFPDRVLTNLIEAYSKRDSVGYVNAYDRYEYIGASKDPAGGVTSTYHWIDEQHHIQKLAEATTIVGKPEFNLGAASSWARLPSDDLSHPEWAVIQISGSQLSLVVDDVNARDPDGPGRC